MQKPKVKIYTPSQKSVKDYGLGDSVDVTINGQAVIPILADKIYKSPYSAIRELYVNEVTAVKKALRINPNLKPEIHITIDSNTRELIIKGVDSLGIDSDTFKYILAVMGNSGNNKGDETGYYGLGFYSFVKISERIIINSYSLESGEKWACIAKSALKFEKLPEDSFKPLNKTGFEITLTIKNELKIDNIISRIKEISKLSGVKTVLKIDNANTPLEQYDDLEHYFKSVYSDYFDNKANYSLMYEHINNDDFELITGYKAGKCDGLQEAFLINVPIELDFYRMNSICLLNVKNERIFKPSADRERFSEKDEESLKEEIQKYDFEKSDKLDKVETLDDFYSSNYKYFHDYIGKLSLHTYVKTGLKRDSWDNSIQREYLKDVLPKQKPEEFRISKTLRKTGFIKLKEKNIFAVQCAKSYDYDSFINAGFLDIDHDKKTSTKTRTYDPNRRTKRFKFYNRYDSFEVLPDNAIAVIRVNDVRSNDLKWKVKTNKIYFITQRADFESNLEIEKSEFINLVNMNKLYFTNKGLLTTSQILEIMKRFNTYEERTSFYGDEPKEGQRRYMEHLYNYKPEYFIIRFDDTLDSQILKTYLEFENIYIGNESIDFYQIEREQEEIKFNKWKNENFKDTRLLSLVEKLNFENNYNDEFRQVLISLQRSLDKNDS